MVREEVLDGRKDEGLVCVRFMVEGAKVCYTLALCFVVGVRSLPFPASCDGSYWGAPGGRFLEEGGAGGGRAAFQGLG